MSKRKDNIINLEKVWHDNKDIPKEYSKVIALDKFNNILFCGTCIVTKNTYRANITSSITTMSSWESVSKWAYLEDLILK